MNTELLRRVADHIDAFPESFNLSTWARPTEPECEQNICDSVGCVAGWVVMLTHPMVRVRMLTDCNYAEEFPWNTAAADELELDYYSAEVLFTSSRWWALQMYNLGFEPIGWNNEKGSFDGEYVHLDAVPPKAASTILRALADNEIDLDGEWLD